VANTGKLRSNGQVPVARGGEILYFTASRRKINIDFLLEFASLFQLLALKRKSKYLLA
jgi:hypothetical protein